MVKQHVNVAAFTILFIFSQNPPATSVAQSEDTKNKNPVTSPQGNSISASQKPKITYREPAKYTEKARRNCVHGVVRLRVVFGLDGTISEPTIISGLPDGLNESAITAAGKIRFEPAIKDGKPIPVRGELQFEFNLYALGEKAIRAEVHNDFSVLSEDVVQLMVAECKKNNFRDTKIVWGFEQQSIKTGLAKLPQSEKEELAGLELEAMQTLDEPKQKLYQKLLDSSKTRQLEDFEEIQFNQLLFEGIAKLPDEKRARTHALYNKAATLGIGTQ